MEHGTLWHFMELYVWGKSSGTLWNFIMGLMERINYARKYRSCFFPLGRPTNWNVLSPNTNCRSICAPSDTLVFCVVLSC